MLTEKVKKYLNKIVNSSDQELGNFDEVRKGAKELLQDYFKEEIREQFRYDIKDMAGKNKSIITEKNKCDFVQKVIWEGGQKVFVNDNWDKLDEIMDILKEEIEILEEGGGEENE